MTIDERASTVDKIKYSITSTVWYGPLLIYTAVMTTISVVLILTGVKVG